MIKLPFPKLPTGLPVRGLHCTCAVGGTTAGAGRGLGRDKTASSNLSRSSLRACSMKRCCSSAMRSCKRSCSRRAAIDPVAGDVTKWSGGTNIDGIDAATEAGLGIDCDRWIALGDREPF